MNTAINTNSTQDLKPVVKELFFFTLPILFGQLGLMLIGVGDVLVASKYSTTTVAAIGVANGLLAPVFLFGIGLMFGVSARLSMKRGRGEEVESYYTSTIIYSLIVGSLLTIIMLGLNVLVPYAGFEENLVTFIQDYISIVAWSFPFGILFQVIKEYKQSKEEVMLPNIIAIIAVFVNVALNYCLVFGKFGFPNLGVKGLAIASLTMRILMSVSLIALSKYKLDFKTIDFKYIKETFLFSYPIACMFFLEVLAFALVNVFVGWMGVVQSASNYIVMNLASVTFMIPLSISSAVSVKVGASFGEKNLESIKVYTKAALLMTCVFMLFSASAFIVIPEQLIMLFSSDVKVIKLGAQILFLVALFQLADGLQVTISGILRGLGKTKETSAAIFIGYWVIGLPFGALLAFYYDKQSIGLWIGLLVSLVLVAIILGSILLKTESHLKREFELME